MSQRFVSNITLQAFPFQNPLINYLINNTNGNLLKKLHKSCKWFFVKLPFIVLDELRSFVNESNNKYAAYFTSNRRNDAIEKGNIWVLDLIFIHEDPTPPSIASKIVKCDVRQLILSISISFNELKLFTNSGNVTCFGVDNKIYYSDNTLVPPENILPLVPKASQIMIRYFNFSNETMQKLVNLDHSVKIVNLIWLYIDEWIDMTLLCQFLEKFLDQDSNPYVSIYYNDQGMKAAFGIEICETIKTWKPAGRIPRNFPHINATCAPPSQQQPQ